MPDAAKDGADKTQQESSGYLSSAASYVPGVGGGSSEGASDAAKDGVGKVQQGIGATG